MLIASEEFPIDIRGLSQQEQVSLRPREIKAHGVRSPGLHLSSVTQKMHRASGFLKERMVFGRNTFDPILEEDLPMCMALGMAWEEWLIPRVPKMDRVNELHSDGIAMSPDAVSFNCSDHLLSPERSVTVLEEIKVTWKGSKHPDHVHALQTQHQNYLMQTKAYSRALNTLFARLYILYVNGNYKFGDDPGGGPHIYRHHIKFTPWELQSNWDEILRNKHK